MPTTWRFDFRRHLQVFATDCGGGRVKYWGEYGLFDNLAVTLLYHKT